MLLTFVSTAKVKDAELFLSFDEEGLDVLRRALDDAFESGHTHLWAWGGAPDLSVTPEVEQSTYKIVTIGFVRADESAPAV